RAAVHRAEPVRSGSARRREPLDRVPPDHVSAADADDAVRARERDHQFVPARRSHRRDDPGRSRQYDVAAALLHLRSRVQVLGRRLCRGADDGAARPSCRSRDRAVRLSRAADPLPMSRAYEIRGLPLAIETFGAWLLALLWVLPLAYALWTAFHPAEYSARFVVTAPLTLENFRNAWDAAPFARYFL